MSSEPQLQLRILTEEDAEDFRTLRLRALRDVPMAYASSYEEWVTRPIESIKQRLRNEDESPDNFVMAAFRGEMVGMVGLLRHREIKLRHKALIWGVYVAPE